MGPTFCGTCGAPFDGSHQFCEQCGIFLGDPSWAPANARVCPKCAARNAPERKECGRCYANLSTGLDRIFERPPSPVPVPLQTHPQTLPGSLAEAACVTCGTVNEHGAPFCASCGRYLEWEGSVASESAANDRPPRPG